jgi:hypothetical protein
METKPIEDDTSTKVKGKSKQGFHEGKTKISETKQKNANTMFDGLEKSAFKATVEVSEKKSNVKSDLESEKVQEQKKLQDVKESKTEVESGDGEEKIEVAVKLPQEIEEGNIEYKV